MQACSRVVSACTVIWSHIAWWFLSAKRQKETPKNRSCWHSRKTRIVNTSHVDTHKRVQAHTQRLERQNQPSGWRYAHWESKKSLTLRTLEVDISATQLKTTCRWVRRLGHHQRTFFHKDCVLHSRVCICMARNVVCTTHQCIAL